MEYTRQCRKRKEKSVIESLVKKGVIDPIERKEETPWTSAIQQVDWTAIVKAIDEIPKFVLKEELNKDIERIIRNDIKYNETRTHRADSMDSNINSTDNGMVNNGNYKLEEK